MKLRHIKQNKLYRMPQIETLPLFLNVFLEYYRMVIWKLKSSLNSVKSVFYAKVCEEDLLLSVKEQNIQISQI